MEFLEKFWIVHGLFGFLGCDLCIKLRCDVHEAGNFHGIRVHKVEPILDGWAVRGQPTIMFWGLLKSVLSLCELDQKCPYVVCMKLFELNGCVV